MQHFKTIALILSVFIISTSCNQRDNFDSLSNGENEQILASGGPTHKEEIQNLVNQKEIVKIGNKKNRNAVNISETVGQNNLKNHFKKPSKAKDEKKVVTIEVGIKAEQSEQKKMKFTKNLSLLFYIDNKASSCVRKFRDHSEKFLHYLNKAPHWDMAFSFHRDDRELIRVVGLDENGILSKNRDRSGFFNLDSVNFLKFSSSDKEILRYALSVHHENPDRDRLNDLEIRELNQGPGYTNPLKGLDQTLNLFKDNTAGQKVVLYFHNNFPYYSSKEWQDLYAKHKNLTILAVSKTENFSNLKGLAADVDLTPVYGCAEATAKAVSDSLSHILKRLK